MAFLSSEKPRIVVRLSLKHVTAQIVAYTPQGDKILASAHSCELKKLGWNYHAGNLPSAYITGLLLGKKAKQKKVADAILDSGRVTSTKGNRVYAVAKGTLDAGINIPIGKEIIGDEKRLRGEHIAAYATQVKDKNMFTKNISNGADPKQMPAQFDKIKQKIMG